MANYRRARAKGGTFFFTVVLADRKATTLTSNIRALRVAYNQTRKERSFICDAFVVLPDHLHCVWTLPDGDADFSTRWRLIKSRFTRSVAAVVGEDHPPYISASKRRKGEQGIWQRRFWEHQIRDSEDYRRHVEYCWANPVKHGLVARPVDWEFSSIHRDIRAGRVSEDWIGVTPAGDFGE